MANPFDIEKRVGNTRGMQKTQTAAAQRIITQAASLPELPAVRAADMLRSQAYEPTAEERAAIVARADFFESIGMTRAVTVAVFDFHGARIGSIVFNV